MAEGIQVEVEGGFARIQFLDPSQRGPAVSRLLELGGPEMIDVDTRSGPRKIYIVPEGMAQEAGLLDDYPIQDTSPETDDDPETDGDPIQDTSPETDSSSLPDGDPSESWTVAQLRDYAAQEEISLAGAERKAEILAVIRAAIQPAASNQEPAQE